MSGLKPVQHVPAQIITATNTPANGVNLAGFNSCTFLIFIGTITNIANSPQPSFAFKIQHSDDDVTYEDVTDANYLLTHNAKAPVTAPDSTTGVFLTVDNAAEDAALYAVGYIGPKQFARVVGTASNTPGNTPYAVAALLAHANMEPTVH